VRFLVFCVLLTVARTFTGTGGHADADYAPFPVVVSQGTVLRVDIGTQAERAQLLRRATVLTPSGTVGATLVRTERICEWLCEVGNEKGKECHFEAVLRASTRVDKAIAVLPGVPGVREIAAIAAGPDQPIGSPDRWIAAEPIGTANGLFVGPAFPVYF
jgi:hypothetical protein